MPTEFKICLLLTSLLFAVIFFKSCGQGSELKASDRPDIECEILNAWEFKRCENAEVVCYSDDNGLSCHWKL